MNLLLYARAQMGLSLAFHILFAAAGVALPLLLFLSDALHWRTGDSDYRDLSQRLAKGTAILFAVGAVSGTALSFELGLLWPTFMGKFGEVVGLPFSLEGYAFFTEAIFLGIYLYGKERVSRGFHLFSAGMVAFSGAASAFFVTLVNAWMNLPRGFRMENGVAVEVDPLAAMFSPSWSYQTVHVLISSYQATAWAMVGIHALMLLRYPLSGLHRKALGLAFSLAAVTSVLQPFSGDRSAKHVAEFQPTKLAALEAHYETSAGAPLLIGGIPDSERGEVRYGLKIPGGLSLLAKGDSRAVVLGLREFPREDWPNVASTHLAFQTMVGAGTAMALLSLLGAFLWWRQRGVPTGRMFLRALVLASPLGLVALEAGWLVTEWGRQPWIVRGVMRTQEAVTSVHSAGPFWIFTLVYLLLGTVVTYLLIRQVRATVPGAPEVGDAH